MKFQCDRKNMVSGPFQFSFESSIKGQPILNGHHFRLSFPYVWHGSVAHMATFNETMDDEWRRWNGQQWRVGGPTFLPTVDINCRFHFHFRLSSSSRVSAIQSFAYIYSHSSVASPKYIPTHSVTCSHESMNMILHAINHLKIKCGNPENRKEIQ